MHGRVERSARVYRPGNVQLRHLLPQGIPPFIGQRWGERLPPAGQVRIDVAGNESLLFDAALKLFDPRLRADPRRLRQLAYRRDLIRPEAGDPGDQVVAGLGPVAAYQLRAEVMSHRGRLRRKKQAVDPGVRHPLELPLHRLRQLLVADLQARPQRLGQMDNLLAPIGL